MRQLLPARMLRDCAAWLAPEAALIAAATRAVSSVTSASAPAASLAASAASPVSALAVAMASRKTRWPLRRAQRCSPSQCRYRTTPLDRAPCVCCTASLGPEEPVPLRQVIAAAVAMKCRFHLLPVQKFAAAEAQTCSAGALREPHVRRSVLAITYPCTGYGRVFEGS